ncbi:hypothetical protein FQA47_008552 [Oryzias melastigma]|uniref:Uncharacterized protein n=1 Tax=Oryzias melastigma TaxID=30732 RepID=A0A834EZG2_ORYME|nr:hypothetical protein FQA47_008552 [Oryzias melastigma]
MHQREEEHLSAETSNMQGMHWRGEADQCHTESLSTVILLARPGAVLRSALSAVNVSESAYNLL